MISVEELLKPISDDKPCGPDLSYPGIDELETLLKGKPEVEIGNMKKPEEPPDWKELAEKSASFLRQSKHLRAAVILCGALLKTEKPPVAGFRDGLAVVRGLVEQFWAPVYPLLDPDDNNDPTQRLNILSTLTVERGKFSSGWLRIVDDLHGAALCIPKGGSAITFDDIHNAALRERGGDGVPANAPDPAKLAKAIRDGGRDQIEAAHNALLQSIETLKGLDQFLTSTLGAGGTISFEVLQKTLQDMAGGIQRYVGNGEASGASAEGAGAEDGGTTDAGPGGIRISGTIRTPDDVVSTIERICAYYSQVEPCSPVPYVLRRVQKLAKMNFVEAVQELNLATIDALKPSMGSAVEEPPPPAPETPAS